MFDDEMLTIEDLAAYLKLRPQTIYKWAQTGKVPGAKFGKEWRFRRSTIEKWIDSHIPPYDGTPKAATQQRAGENAGDPAGSGAAPEETTENVVPEEAARKGGSRGTRRKRATRKLPERL